MPKQFYVDVRGYNEGVTGSCIRNTYHSSYNGVYRFLVDYGVYQGEGHKGLEYNESINPKKIDAILLTHTHLDHDGALPIIVKQGYTGKIYMSEASSAVIDIGLRDSYNIMKRDAKLKGRSMLYSEADIDDTIKQIVAVKYGEPVRIHNNITVTFFNNGHLIGSSITLVQIDEPNGKINLLYTGDYKPDNMFLNIKPLPYWVYALPNLTIITESTYGTTNTSDIQETWDFDIAEACSQGKTIFNSGFGQGRIQELMFRIRQLQDKEIIPKDYPVKVDGPTAISYTFRYLDKCNVLGLKENAMNFFPHNLQFIDNNTRPFILASNKGKKIILSTSGMGSHGPAAAYIPNYLKEPNCLIYFPGYTSEGTLGREAFEKNYGEEIYLKDGRVVKKMAEVKQTGEFSSHAKADELIDFINMFSARSVLITHGAPEVKEIFEKRVQNDTYVKKTGILGMGYVYRINPFGIDKKVRK